MSPRDGNIWVRSIRGMKKVTMYTRLIINTVQNDLIPITLNTNSNAISYSCVTDNVTRYNKDDDCKRSTWRTIYHILPNI